jgi:glucosamine--fructose-6-phosphate aminotransferase (isomerizing)
MCGIITLLSKNNVIPHLLDGLNQLQNRGYDSAGIVYYKNNSLILKKYASKKTHTALKDLELERNKYSNLGLGHTRWATHGSKSDENSHPHISNDGKIVLVHNDIIENFNELKNNLELNGYKFYSETDTEVIVNLISSEYKKTGNIRMAIQNSVKKMSGTWGLAIICVDYPNKLFAIRHGSPLLVSENENDVVIASEQSGFNGRVSNYFILEGNDLCEITLDQEINIETSNKYEMKEASKENFDLTPYPYEHWTLKEIEEQYESSLRALSFGGRIIDNKVRLGGLNLNKEKLKKIDNIIFLACGTSYNASLLGVQYFKELNNFNTIQAFDGAEFNEKDIPKYGKTALIFLSQSGETRDLYRCIEIGRKSDLFLIGVVNVIDSMIAREVDCGCYINAGREVGVASTKSFINQVIILILMALWFNQLHFPDSNLHDEYLNNLRQLPKQIKKTFDISKNNINNILNIANKDNLFILGKDNSEPIAYEGALKIKEIAYIHAEGYSGSSLKHGPFALLDKEFPVILLAPFDKNYNKMLNVYQEIKTREAPILFITSNEKCNLPNSIILPYNKNFSHLLSIIPLQYASYYLALNRNHHPDYPRNLSKSVTVE